MRVLLLPVLQSELPQEALPFRAPCHVIGEPRRRRGRVLRTQEPLRERVELDARIQFRPARGAPSHLAEGVEGAALDARCRPYRARRPRESGRSVCHRHDGRGHSHHEGCVWQSNSRQLGTLTFSSPDAYAASPSDLLYCQTQATRPATARSLISPRILAVAARQGLSPDSSSSIHEAGGRRVQRFSALGLRVQPPMIPVSPWLNI